MDTTVDVLAGVQAILVDIFMDDDIEIDAETTADDIPGWDSLSHTIVMLSIEKKFGISIARNTEFANIGELVAFISRELESASVTRQTTQRSES
ncbi:MAG: acyl carrier protein [Chromatiales bacterium]|nr:acyl carrier protein [Chromatiales bacterium]